jgi:5,10-methylenetetrahydromethanopterin reductase
MTQVWMVGVAAPNSIPRHAERLEADGFSGLAVVDSQNLSGDPYVALALAATVTDRLGLATGVTNPYTRHPAATACSIASVQTVSKGRAVLGIGRGDSALAHLGLSPAPVPVFARYLRRLQGYLRGDDVPFDDEGDVASVDALGLAARPDTSRIQWIANLPKVPLDVAASGPRVIELAATIADQITFAVGADVERLQWGIDLARAARRRAGLDPDTLGLGAYVNVAVHADLDIARRLVAGGLSTLARFNVMHGRTAGPLGTDDRAVLTTLHERYDMNHHTQPGSAQADSLTPEFAGRHAVLGSPADVLRRFAALTDLGIDRFVLMGAPRAPGLDDEGKHAQQAFVADVLPALVAA